MRILFLIMLLVCGNAWAEPIRVDTETLTRNGDSENDTASRDITWQQLYDEYPKPEVDCHKLGKSIDKTFVTYDVCRIANALEKIAEKL